MTLSESKLRRIIREEAARVLREQTAPTVDPKIATAIDQRYVAYLARIKTVVSAIMAAEPAFKGIWNLTFKINPDGTVAPDSINVAPDVPTVAHERFETGVKNHVKSFKFPAPGVDFTVNKKIRVNQS